MNYDNNKILFIVASDYPYGPGEPFLENELQYISLYFEKIYFIVTSDKVNISNPVLFEIPKNSEILLLNKNLTLTDKLFFLRKIFSKKTISELLNVKYIYKLKYSFSILKTTIHAILGAFFFKRKLLKTLSDLKISENKNLYFYSYWCTEHTLGLLLLKNKLKNIKVFTRAHGWDVYFERNTPPYLPFRKYILKNIAAFFTISENGNKYYQKKLNYTGNNLNISRLGTKKVAFKKKNKNNSHLKILSLAYIVPLKRIELLIDSLILIDNINITWIHIGGHGTFNKVKSYAQEKLYNKKNIYYSLLGNLTKEEIYNHLESNEYDFLINTSSTEGIPVSMMEAMSFGIPCIGTNVGGVSEIINNEINGYLMEADPSPEQIVKTIDKYNNCSDSEIQKLRLNAHKTWEEKYNAEINYTQFAKDILNL